jgi:hypothetical protein
MPQNSIPHATYASASDRQAFHRPRTSMGASGHWLKTAGILAPLLIGEFVKDAEQRWRWIRISSVVTALGSEALWTNKIRKERQERALRNGQEEEIER